MANLNKDEFLWRDEPIADRIMNWWKESEGMNIFGQPVEPPTSEDISGLAMGVVGGPIKIVKSASSALKMFQGWRDNLLEIAKTVSKKEKKRIGYVINQALGRVQHGGRYGSIEGTKQTLHSVNKEFGVKVLVPEIKKVAVAGRQAIQQAKARGAHIPRPKKEMVNLSELTEKAIEKRKSLGYKAKLQRQEFRHKGKK